MTSDGGLQRKSFPSVSTELQSHCFAIQEVDHIAGCAFWMAFVKEHNVPASCDCASHWSVPKPASSLASWRCSKKEWETLCQTEIYWTETYRNKAIYNFISVHQGATTLLFPHWERENNQTSNSPLEIWRRDLQDRPGFHEGQRVGNGRWRLEGHDRSETGLMWAAWRHHTWRPWMG